jgi:uncharacterized protein YndB with AHSA1/START domain
MTASTDRIEKKILLKATRARVWRALSEAEEFGKWFGVALAGQTFAAGQRVRGQMNANCGHDNVMFEAFIVEMKPERLLSYRWHPYAVDAAIDYSKEETTLVVMELADAEGGTLLKVVESGFDKVAATRRLEAFRMNSRGWEAQLQNVARYVEAS